jgi:hypothetical protein
MRGPENWRRLERMARNPPMKKVNPIYFRKDFSNLPTLVSEKE